MSRANRAWSPRRLAAAAALALALTVGLSAILPAGNAIAAGSYPAQPTPPDPPDPTPDPQPTPDPDPTPDPQPTPDPEPTPDPQPTPGPQPTVVPTDPALVPDPAAEAAAAAAELARDRAQDAAERAADLAAAQSRTTDAWVSRGRPERMIVVRDLSIETVSNGKLTAQIPRSGGALTLGGLDRLAPDGWVTMAADAARLSATVVLTPGASLDLGGVKTLRLAGGATVPEAASIYSGSGRLIARDVTVTSVDPDTDQAMGPAAGRPFVVVSAGGRLDATDATFSDLGTLPTDPENHGGVQFNDGATGSLTRATMRRNSVGLRLAGTDGIKVDGLLVEESAADGLVLEGDRGTTITQVRAERNGADGVLIKGEGTAGRTISGIATTGNKGYGLSVIGQKAPKIIGVVTTADATGGLRVNRSSQVQVVDFTATDQPIGIFTHVGSKDLRFERITITGGRRGVVVEKSTSGLVMRESTIDGASVVGVGIGGHDVSLDGLSVAGARTGVKIERGAANVTATGLSLSGGEDGFVANPGSTAVVLRDLVAQGIGNDAVRTYSPEMQIVGARLTGADTGVVAAAATVVSNTAITEVETGLRARGTGVVMADRIDVAALTLGIDAAPGSSTQLKDSKVQALEALRGPVQLLGHNELSLPPLNLLGAIGMPLILLAIALELVHALRQRRFQRPGRGVPPLAVPAGA